MFYKVIQSTNRKEIGYYPQVSRFSNENLIGIERLNEAIDRFPNLELPTIFLHKKAKLTDVISCATLNDVLGFIASERLIGLLSRFKLLPTKKMKVNIDGVVDNYYWIHMIPEKNQHNWIDYSLSTFLISNSNHQLRIKSHDHYQRAKKSIESYQYIKAKRIAVFKDDIKDYDLVRFYSGHYKLFVSKKLKEALEEKNITGWNFSLIDSVDFIDRREKKKFLFF